MVMGGPGNVDPIGSVPLRGAFSGTAVRRTGGEAEAGQSADSSRPRIRNLLETGLRLNNGRVQEVQAEITRNQLSAQNIDQARGVLSQFRRFIEDQELGSELPPVLTATALRRTSDILGNSFQGQSLNQGLSVAELGLENLPGLRREEALVTLDQALQQLNNAAQQAETRQAEEQNRLAALNVERENLTAAVSGRIGGNVRENLDELLAHLPETGARFNLGRENVLILIG